MPANPNSGFPVTLLGTKLGPRIFFFISTLAFIRKLKTKTNVLARGERTKSDSSSTSDRRNYILYSETGLKRHQDELI